MERDDHRRPALVENIVVAEINDCGQAGEDMTRSAFVRIAGCWCHDSACYAFNSIDWDQCRARVVRVGDIKAGSELRATLRVIERASRESDFEPAPVFTAGSLYQQVKAKLISKLTY